MIERISLYQAAEPAANGQFVRARDFATEDWRTDKPERPDSLMELRWPITAQWGTMAPRTVWYWDGRFRNANGTVQSVPMRWAYYRLIPEVWNGTAWTLPDGSQAQAQKPDLAQTIGLLRAYYSPKEILDEMDRWTFKNAPGAPL